MTQRIQLIKDVYMNLDGQPAVVLSGTVFDAPLNYNVHPSTAIILSPTESAGPVANAMPTSVRNVRKK